MRNDADGLDIVLFAEPGGDDAAKPALAQVSGIGAHAMDDLNDAFRQNAKAVMLTLDRGGRQCCFAPTAESARQRMARFGGDRDTLAVVPPGAGTADPAPGTGAGRGQVITDPDRRGRIKLAHWRLLR